MDEQDLQMLERRLHNTKTSNGAGDGTLVTLTPRELSNLIADSRLLNLERASRTEAEKVCMLLVRSGHVTEAAVVEAFAIAHDHHPGPMTPAVDTGD